MSPLPPTRLFESVLVANRGEVAVRITRTLHRLGIRAVAVYSDADAGVRHVREADVAVRLGPAAPRESYLNIERLLEVAAATGAQAVHPGYGFLAENAAFVRACEQAGLVFVGPPVAAVEVMGDKIRAKAAVAAAGVPVVPGGSGSTDAELADAAERVGYPVLVKPSAGGGGKGMRVVTAPGDLREALASARREAASSFGDDTLLLERFVQRPRHVEVQVMADAHGTVLHLGERECSLQRRHQKVVEEAPSPLLDGEARERWGALAVATARAVGYRGAGTVELIVSAEAPDEPFFMEMNTRLQVEHPVTELVTGLDLVELQLRVAAGEPLGLTQSDVRLTGHAVEARVYAEDPARGFLPTGGTALLLREPADAAAGVRIDSSLLQGEPVGTTYDPMLSKVITWGPDRATALTRLDDALARTVVLGVGTNTAFLRALLAHPDVQAGRLDTGLLERSLHELVSPEADLPDSALAAAALARLLALEPTGPVVDLWQVPSGWRVGDHAETRLRLAGPGGEALEVAVSGTARAAVVRLGERRLQASASAAPDGLLLTLDGVTRTVLVAVAGATTWVHVDGAAYALTELPPARVRGQDDSHDGEVLSPMPGAVVAVRAVVGEAVTGGQPLLVVEAMKMEHTLTAPFDGVVAELGVRAGDQVVVGQQLARVSRREPQP